MEKIQESPFWNTQIFVRNDIGDGELEFLYEKARALIFPSRSEGFGIPLKEEIKKGISVIASDLPVFREVGGEYPEFFRPGDSKNLAEALSTLLQEKQAPSRRSILICPTWDDSAIDLIEKSVDMYKKSRQECAS